MCHLEKLFRVSGLTLGFNDLKRLFQPKCFNISMIKKVPERNCEDLCEDLCILTLYTGSSSVFSYISFLLRGFRLNIYVSTPLFNKECSWITGLLYKIYVKI